jgi:hypothetical protein
LGSGFFVSTATVTAPAEPWLNQGWVWWDGRYFGGTYRLGEIWLSSVIAVLLDSS